VIEGWTSAAVDVPGDVEAVEARLAAKRRRRADAGPCQGTRVSTQFAESGERLDARTVREWGRRYSNWRRFGPDDELGTLNFITPDRVIAAASLVRTGLVVSCALPFGADDGDAGAPRGARWQPLAGVARDGRVYNDRDPGEMPAVGASAAAIDRFADGVVARGVLLDLPRFAAGRGSTTAPRSCPPTSTRARRRSA
jgi:hypothetical protein